MAMQQNAPVADGPARPRPARVQVGGIAMDRMTGPELAQQMVADWRRNVAAGRQLPARLVFDANGQAVSLYGRDAEFRAWMDQADLMHADGMSLVWASRLLTRAPLPERVATTDFFHDCAAAAEAAGLSFYMLGATREVNDAAAANVRAAYPNLRIAGHRDGYFAQSEEVGIIEEVVASGADVLWIARGRRFQEGFAIAHRHRLAGVTWIHPCGGLFDFLSGFVRRAPDWVQTIGMEWLYRTMQEPRRLFLRYFLTSPHAIYRMAVATRALPDDAPPSGRP